MDLKEDQMRWIKYHLHPGKVVYLEDSNRDDSLPSGHSQNYYQCRLVSLDVGQPVWLRLKLINPEKYPEIPGAMVDRVENTQKGKHLYCSFRSLKAMMKHVFTIDHVRHLEGFREGAQLKIAELVFDNAWANLCFREKVCPARSKCSSTDIGHLACYQHPK